MGEGTYGCAFKPALKCKGKTRRSSNSISKLMFKDKAEKEYKTKRQLESINRGRKYFIYPQELCDVDARIFDPEVNNVASCSKPFYYNTSKAKIIEYPYGGYDLTNIALHPSEYIAFFNGFSNIFTAVETLHRNNMAHLDIKPGNLVALKQADGTFNFRMIDFGFLTKVDDKQKIMSLPLHVDYYIWPYDIKFSVIVKKKRGILRDILQTFSEENITYDSVDEFQEVSLKHLQKRIPLIIYDGLGDLTVDNYKEIYEEINKKNTLDERLNLVLKAADVYSLAITLGELYRKYTKHIMIKRPTGEYKYTIDIPGGSSLFSSATQWNIDVANKITTQLYRLLALMMSPDPEERISITDAKNRYNAILPDINKYFTEEKIRDGLGSIVYFAERPMSPYRSNIEPAAIVPNSEVSTNEVAANINSAEMNRILEELEATRLTEMGASEPPMGGAKWKRSKKGTKTRKIRK